MKILGLIFFLCLSGFANIDIKKEITALKPIGNKVLDGNEKADLIFIDFWASWCDPCKESFPFYEMQIKKQKTKNVLFVSVNLDEKIQKAEQFLKQFPQSHITVWDEKKKMMGLLDFSAVPYMLILDKDWKVLEQIKGFNDRTKKKVKDYL